MAVPDPPSDDATIAADFASPDKDVRLHALETAVQRHSQKLGAAIYQRFGESLDEHELLEVVSRTFEEVWKKLLRTPWPIHRSLFGLLRRLAVWRALDLLATQKIWRDRYVGVEDYSELERPAEEVMQPWDGIERREKVEGFRRLVNKLRGLQREVGDILFERLAEADCIPGKIEVVAALARRGRVTTEESVKSCFREIARKLEQRKKHDEEKPSQRHSARATA